MNRIKSELGLDKRKWKTSPLPGQIVLVSTISRDRIPNLAPKSWIAVVAFEPLIIGLGCTLKHQTAKNILETGEFVINVPSEDLVKKVWKTAYSPHSGDVDLQKLGFTMIPSVKVSPPRIRECKAHLECTYESDKRYGNEIWIFGKTVFVSIDKEALEGSSQERHKYLNPIFYLEKNTYGVLGDVKPIQTRRYRNQVSD
jgi:flavin reductase (DIM6/NTAB) family NADH-FMN oxidoreductase RutF